MADVANFVPSTNGLSFSNSWPDEADIVVKVGALGRVTIGHASKGLCGGMVFTVMDVFMAGLPPLRDPQPPQGSPLFDYIVRRVFSSWNLPWGVFKYYRWMTLPDQTVRRRTVLDEWPGVRSDLDAGRLSPLGLVTVKSTNPSQLGRNHQVLAYGYEVNADQVTIKVYDPNTELSGADDVRISFRSGHPVRPLHPTTITHNVGIREQIRGFFRVPYVPADPAPLQPG